MKAFLVVAVALLAVLRSPRPIGSADVVHIKSASAAALAPEARTNSNDSASAAAAAASKSSKKSTDDVAGGNDTTPCDRHLRSAADVVEVRNPRNHKFVTSNNGWTERQRPRPEINVYSRIEELPSPQPPAAPAAAAATSYYHQQRDNYYQHSRQQPAVRTSKRIIYYATLPDVVRPPAGYPPPPPPPPPPLPYSADSFGGTGGPSPFSADFRHIDSNRNGPAADLSQRNRLAPYENAYNNRGGGVTSVTSKSTAVYNSRYDEPAEFRDPFFRNNEFSSKFASWAEPFYKSWTSPSPPPPWDRDPITRFSNWSPFSWDREPLGGGSGPLHDNRVSSSWENRGSSWDKELVEVPLQKPTVGSRGDIDDGNGGENKFGPEVAVVKSGVIDVRSSPPPPPPRPGSRFTIVDVDPKPYRPEHVLPASMRFDERRDQMIHQQQQQQQQQQHHPNGMRFDDDRRDQQKPMRHETYTPMQPPTRYVQDMPPPPPPYMQHRYEQQYRAPPSSSSSSSQYYYGQHDQNNKQQPSKSYYETSKNNVNTHQFMTSWTEVSTTHDDDDDDGVTPTHSVNLDISSIGNSTSVHNNTRIIPYTTNNTTKTPK